MTVRLNEKTRDFNERIRGGTRRIQTFQGSEGEVKGDISLEHTRVSRYSKKDFCRGRTEGPMERETSTPTVSPRGVGRKTSMTPDLTWDLVTLILGYLIRNPNIKYSRGPLRLPDS